MCIRDRYESNAHEKRRPASVTKVMTLLLVMEALESGSIGWDDTVTTSAAVSYTHLHLSSPCI